MATQTRATRTPETIYRDMTVTLDRAALAALAKRDGDGSGVDDRIPIAISSEAPVQRYDFWDDEIYNEVLDHSAASIDLSYARDGLPFLDGHNVGQQMGLVEDITVGADGVLRGMVRMSKRQAAQDLRQDMLDGIRQKISVGYRQLETVTTDSEDANTPSEVRVTRWLPMEASSVSIPADYGVGVGRSNSFSAGSNPYHISVGASGDTPVDQVNAAIAVLRRHSPHTLSAPKAKEQPVSDKTTAAPNGVVTDSAQVRVGAIAEERERLTEINDLCETHAIENKVRSELLSTGASIADAQRKVLDIVRARMAKPTTSGPLVELSEKEQKQYSFARAIAAHDPNIRGVDAGFEREIEQELERKLPEQYKRRGGILLPTMVTRAGLDSQTATKGLETKFTQPGEFIDLLRARMKVRALGARVLAGLTGPVSMVKQTAAAQGSWVSENPGADVADTNLLYGLVTLAIKTYQASTAFSRQLLVSALSGSIDAESMVREDLALVHALAFDKAAIYGTGANNQPKGVLNTAGIGVVASGVNGGAPTFGNIVDLETAVSNANADVETMAYLTTPGMRGKLKQTLQAPGVASAFVWQGKDELNGYTGEVSTQVPNALVKGTSNDCHAIIFGDFSSMVLGEWGVIELIADPFRLKKQGMIEVTSFQMGDVAIRTAESFAAMQDARNV